MNTSDRSFKWGLWTPEEDRIILENPEGVSIKERALQVGRTEAAVAKRLKDLRAKAAASNGTESVKDPAAVPEPEDIAAPQPTADAMGQLEGAIAAVGALLAHPSLREDGFFALKRLLDVWVRLRALDP